MRRLVLLGVLLASSSAFADEKSRCENAWGAIRGCHRRYVKPWRPILTAALEGGASHWNEGGPGKFNDGFGAATTAGGVWGARVGVDFFSWLGLEARYLGMENAVHESYGRDLGYLTTAGIFDVRIGAPIPYVHPYVFTGIGVYNVHLHGDESQRGDFKSATQAGVPIGVGLDVPINWHFSLGVEATYHFQLGESFSHSTANGVDGGDFSTVTGLFRVRI